MDIIAVVRRACREAGDQQTLARQLGVSPAYISDVLNERKEPGPKILDPLGYERVVTYRRRKATTDGVAA